jgi:uncharacterized membrane protein YhaH (DUF805 family)
VKHLNPNVPLGRLAYLVLGVLFGVLKVGVDASLAHHYGRAYSLLFYVDPTSAPLLRPAEVGPYWVALCYTTVPFAIVGVLLTLRRLRDAGATPWLALFFFVPFANLLFFVATALLPPYRRGAKTTVPQTDPFRSQDIAIRTRGTPRSRPAVILYAAALGAVVALGGFGISVGLLGKYGYGLALGTPLISGFVAGAWVPRLLPRARVVDAMLASVFTFVVSLALIIVFALEGLGCLILFLPLLFIPAAAGTLLGFAIGKSIPRGKHGVSVASGILLLLLTFGIEAFGPTRPHDAPMVETSLVIDATPDVVWPDVVRVGDLPPAIDPPFDAGVSYPVRATLDHEGVGAIRRCEFNTGTALETVTVWDAPRRLRFTIDSQPDPLRELTLYRTVRQPHLDGAVRNRIGEFELVALDGGRTKLVGRSWYETTLHPTMYWEAYSEYVIHAIHLRVMQNVKRRAEAPAAIARGTP